MKEILIIGGSGYIGNSTKNFLEQKHLKVKTVDLNWFAGPTPDFLIDYKNLEKNFLSNFSHIVLLAGHSSMHMCKDNFFSAWNNNVTNFSSIIGKLEKQQILIYASSASVYGDAIGKKNENDILIKPKQEYDNTKQVIEKIAENALCKTIGLRFGTLCGSKDYTRSDLLLNAMVKTGFEQKTIQCFNEKNNRGVLGINDCVRAIYSIICDSNDVEHDIFNLSSFNGSIGYFAELVGKCLSVPVIYNAQITNNFSFELSNDKFKDVYNFKFNDTPELIVEELIKNYKNLIWSNRLEKIEYV